MAAADRRALHRFDARDSGPGRPRVDVFRLADRYRHHHAPVRRGIDRLVRAGQTRAALALGMSRVQLVRRILLPQAIVRMLPAFGSLLSITIKDTAIASVIAVTELMRQSETVAGQSFQPIEVFTFAMLVYFVLLFPVTRGVDLIYRRVAHLGRS